MTCYAQTMSAQGHMPHQGFEQTILTVRCSLGNQQKQHCDLNQPTAAAALTLTLTRGNINLPKAQTTAHHTLHLLTA